MENFSMESGGSGNRAATETDETQNFWAVREAAAEDLKNGNGDQSVNGCTEEVEQQIIEDQQLSEQFTNHHGSVKKNQEDFTPMDSEKSSMEQFMAPGAFSEYQEGQQIASESAVDETDIMRGLITEDERKIFVGGLDDQISDYDLVEYFGKFGNVEFVNTIRNHVTGENRGFAFVTFVTIHGLQNALTEATHVVKEKTVGVYKANPRSGRMYIGNLVKEITDADIYEHFSQFGKILKIERPAHPERKNLFCFVVFQSMDTVKKVLSYGKITIKDQEVRAELAKAKPANNNAMPWYGFYNFNVNPYMQNPMAIQEQQERVHENLEQTVFIGGLCSTTGEEELKQQFEAFGEIRSVRILQDRCTKKSRGFGFITFQEAASANKVLEIGSHIVNGKRCGTRKAEPAKSKTMEEGVNIVQEGAVFQEAESEFLPQGMVPAGAQQMPYFTWGMQPYNVMPWNPYYQ